MYPERINQSTEYSVVRTPLRISEQIMADRLKLPGGNRDL